MLKLVSPPPSKEMTIMVYKYWCMKFHYFCNWDQSYCDLPLRSPCDCCIYAVGGIDVCHMVWTVNLEVAVFWKCAFLMFSNEECWQLYAGKDVKPKIRSTKNQYTSDALRNCCWLTMNSECHLILVPEVIHHMVSTVLLMAGIVYAPFILNLVLI